MATSAWHGGATIAGSWLASLVPWPQFTARDVTIGNPDWARQAALRAPGRAAFPAVAAAAAGPPHRRAVAATGASEHRPGTRQAGTRDLDLRPAAKRDRRPRWHAQPRRRSASTEGHVALDDAANAVKLQVDRRAAARAIPYDQIVAAAIGCARAQARTIGARHGAKASTGRGQRRHGSGQGRRRAAPRPRYQFGWKAKGSYQGAALDGQGKTGGVLALQDSSEPFPVQADVRIGDSHIALVGTLTDPLHLGALDVRLWFSGSSMAKLYPLTGITLPDTAALRHRGPPEGRAGARRAAASATRISTAASAAATWPATCCSSPAANARSSAATCIRSCCSSPTWRR